MSLTYTDNGTFDNGHPNIIIFGDGTSTVLIVDLTLPPLNFNYKGNKPIVITQASIRDHSGTILLGSVVLNLNQTITITFETTLLANTFATVSIDLGFAGV